MRALAPTRDGYVEREGARVFFEVYGDGEPTVLLLMPDAIVESRAWKAQVPFLARFCTVVVVDPRGNGRSPAPGTPDGHADRQLMDDAWAVLDTVGAERAVLVGLCSGAAHAVMMAAESSERVLGVCAINPSMHLAPPHPFHAEVDFDEVLDSYEGWAKENRRYWLSDWPGYTRFFFDQMFPEPHSSKQWEDAVGWATGTTVQAMLDEADAPPSERSDVHRATALCRRVVCPVLVICGSDDRCQPTARGRRVAELTGGDFLLIEGAGHFPQARDPVKVNLELRSLILRAHRGS